jgi:hypothetical protein
MTPFNSLLTRLGQRVQPGMIPVGKATPSISSGGRKRDPVTLTNGRPESGIDREIGLRGKRDELMFLECHVFELLRERRQTWGLNVVRRTGFTTFVTSSP